MCYSSGRFLFREHNRTVEPEGEFFLTPGTEVGS
jgi:hypothetical protein